MSESQNNEARTQRSTKSSLYEASIQLAEDLCLILVLGLMCAYYWYLTWPLQENTEVISLYEPFKLI